MIKPLTRDIYIKFNGEPPPTSMRGFASLIDDKIDAICAVTVIRGENFIVFGASENPNKRELIKGWEVFKTLLDKNKTYYALVDEELSTAPGLLYHFGFVYLSDDIYQYIGD